MPYDYSGDEIGPLQDRTPPEPVASTPPRPRITTGWVLWQLFVEFHPRAFFDYIALLHHRWITVACAWAFGMATTLDWLLRLAINPKVIEPWVLDWWWGVGFLLLFSPVLGCVNYLIGGWWYTKRLGWCVYNPPDPLLARKIYVLAAQAFGAPAVIVACALPFFFDSPREAAASQFMAWLVRVRFFMHLRACWASYTGVCTVFQAARGSARVWFLFLPCTYALITSLALMGVVQRAQSHP